MARPTSVPILAGLLAVASGAAVLAASGSVAGATVGAVAALVATLTGARRGNDRQVRTVGTRDAAAFEANSLAPPDLTPPDLTAASLLDGIADPVIVVTDGAVAHANMAARELLGVHILGEDARVALRHPGAAERIALAEDPSGPIMLAGLGGRDRRWEMRVARVGAGRRIVQLVDRSAVHAAERTRTDFVANASHELRTPLASLLGYVETLQDPRGTDAALRQRFLGIMAGEARRMERLIEDLISLSRIEAEQYRAPAGTVDLAALVRQVCRERQDAQDGRGADLAAELPDGPAAVAGDAAQLSQLAHNLVGNAMKYGRAGTPVTVTVAPAGGMWRLTVADRGEGVAPEHLPRLTERFFRVDAGRSRSLGGTGLGLAIAKHVVERHRGRLEIASVVGEGTTVVALLPAADRSLSQKGNADAAGEQEDDGMMRA